ncbi:MAG: class I tRNA ligase family protein [Arenimonas sp.]
MRAVADRVERSGADAWYAIDADELIGAEAADYEKVTDILDVWFDSGVTHEGVLAARGTKAYASRPTCTSKVQTSIAAGSRVRC